MGPLRGDLGKLGIMNTRHCGAAERPDPTIVGYADCQSLEALRAIVGYEDEALTQIFDYVVSDDADGKGPNWLSSGTKRILSKDVHQTLPSDAVFLVGGPMASQRIELLTLKGFPHIYNLNDLARETSAKRRLLHTLAPSFSGSRVPAMLDPVGLTEPHHTLDDPIHLPLPSRLVFLVNSLPKSGSVWLCGMLEHALDISGSDRVRISHCADLVFDQNQPNLSGAVSLVRDMRDVVVSWFHDVANSDMRTGFESARYPDVSSFYFECFVGLISQSDRYFDGNLVGWIDQNCANYCPLLRYEEMVENPQRALTKVLNAWRVRVPEARVAAAVSAFDAASIRETRGPDSGYVGKMYQRGHLRRSGSGSWEEELPQDVLRDIEGRFSDYQQRFGYT